MRICDILERTLSSAADGAAATAALVLLAPDMARRANVASTARREQFTFCVAIALVHLTITTLSFRAQARLERPCSLGVMNSTFCS